MRRVCVCASCVACGRCSTSPPFFGSGDDEVLRLKRYRRTLRGCWGEGGRRVGTDRGRADGRAEHGLAYRKGEGGGGERRGTERHKCGHGHGRGRQCCCSNDSARTVHPVKAHAYRPPNHRCSPVPPLLVPPTPSPHSWSFGSTLAANRQRLHIPPVASLRTLHLSRVVLSPPLSVTRATLFVKQVQPLRF